MADTKTPVRGESRAPEAQTIVPGHPELTEILARFSHVYEGTDAETPYEKLVLINQHFNELIKKGDVDDIISYIVLRANLNGHYDGLKLNTLIRDLREADGLTLDEIEQIKADPDRLPTFEYLFVDPLAGSFVNGKGRVYKMETVFPNSEVAVTIVNEFGNEKNFKRASQLQEFDHMLVEYLRRTVLPRDEYRKLLESVMTSEPKHVGKRLLASTFYRGRDLRREFQLNEDLYDNLESMLDVTKTDMFISFFKDMHAGDGTELQKIEPLLKETQTDKFLKFMYRADLTLKKGKDMSEEANRFQMFFLENIVAPLEGEYQFPSHGDGAPSNVIVTREFDAVTGKDKKKYARIDREKGTRDIIQSHMSQLWVKSPIFDYAGNSVLDEDGLEAKTAHTNELAFLMHQMAEDFGREELITIGDKKLSQEEYLEHFRKITDLAVARDHYFWAVRYHSYVNKVDAGDDKLRKSARYHYTLFAKELVKQGVLNESELNSETSPLKYTNGLFGEPLTDEQLREVHNEIRPRERYISFHDDLALEKRVEAEEAIRAKYRSRRLKRNLSIAGAAVAFPLLIAAGAYQFHKASVDYEQLEREKQMEEVASFFTARATNLKSTDMELAHESLAELFGDDKTAIAWLINQEATYQAIKANNDATDYNTISDFIRDNYVDTWHLLLDIFVVPDFWARTYDHRLMIGEKTREKFQKQWDEFEERYNAGKPLISQTKDEAMPNIPDLVRDREENIQNAYKILLSRFTSPHPNDIREISEEELEDICNRSGINSTYVKRIITYNDMLNPYATDPRFRGLTIFDTEDIEDGQGIQNPMDNLFDGIKRLKTILKRYDLDPEDPLRLNDERINPEYREKLRMKLHDAIVSFLLRQEEIDYVITHGRNTAWYGLQQYLNAVASKVTDSGYERVAPILWPYNLPAYSAEGRSFN